MRPFWRLAVPAIMALWLAIAPSDCAEATPAGMGGLLRTVERDVGAMIEQASVMRGRLGDAIGGEGPGAAIVGIADGGYLSTVRSLHQATLRLDRRLGELRPRLRRLDDGEAGEILLSMRVELSALTLALGELAATEDAALRAEALDRLGSALTALDGATAAAWTLEPSRGNAEPPDALPAESAAFDSAAPEDAIDDRR
jgi:hypothetical protein